MSEKQAIRVDDHPILRERLKQLLQLVSRKPIPSSGATRRSRRLCVSEGSPLKLVEEVSYAVCDHVVVGSSLTVVLLLWVAGIGRKSRILHMPKCFLRIAESLMAGFAGASSAAFLKAAVASSCFPILSSERARL